MLIRAILYNPKNKEECTYFYDAGKLYNLRWYSDTEETDVNKCQWKTIEEGIEMRKSFGWEVVELHYSRSPISEEEVE